jgi:hypothetical protein
MNSVAFVTISVASVSVGQKRRHSQLRSAFAGICRNNRCTGFATLPTAVIRLATL